MHVRSVTGPVDAESLGQVLPHEHLVIDYHQMAGRAATVDADERRRWTDLLISMRQSGIGTIVDCTPPGYGRDLQLLAQLSRDSGVTVIASTGSFCEEWHPLPSSVRTANAEQLAEHFLSELAAHADPGPGVIKVATSHERITPAEHKVLLAASMAHRAHNAPIVAHTTIGLGLEQLDIYADQGVDPSAVLISHVCSGNEPAEYAVEIARRGAYIGFDRIGHEAHRLDHWVDLIIRLVEEGCADRVLLSHDSVQRFAGPAAIAGHTFRDPLFINRVLLPALGRRGVNPETQRRLTHENPARWLTRKEATSQ